MRLDSHTVDIILKQPSKMPSKTFKAVPFIPDFARNQKKGVDQIPIHYKKTVNNDLLYVIKNDKDDIKVLLRAFNEYNHLPYRESNLDMLGKLPEFHCVTKTDVIPESVLEEA